MNLEIPALFYGRYRDVKSRLSKALTRIRRGADWMEVVTADGFLDVAKTPGHIVLHGPNPALGGAPHFHVFAFWMLLYERVEAFPFERVAPFPPKTLDRVFEQSLTTPWSVLGLVAHRNQIWLFPRERYIPFLRAVVTCWDELVTVGRRYSDGSQYPEELWKLPTTIGHVLANQGVPVSVLNSPVPPGGLLTLIQQYGIDLTADQPAERATPRR